MWKRIFACLCAAAVILSSIQINNSIGMQEVEASNLLTSSEEFYTINEDYMDADYYSQLGLAVTTPTLFSESDTTDPLEGYQTAIIDELYVGTMNHDADYKGTFLIADNTETPDSASLYFETFINNKLASQSYSLDSDADTQCISAIAVNTSNTIPENDAIPKQVIVENRIYEYTKGDNDSYQKLIVYTMQDDGSFKEGTGATIMLAEDDGWVGAITIREQGGFTSMTTGDFDSDGQSEVAVHVPSGSQAGYIYIYGLVEKDDLYSLEYENKFEIASLGNRFKWSSGRCRPLVNLTTASMSGKDDIVLNVSLPYDKYSKACDAGVMCVISYSDTSKTYVRNTLDCMVLGSETARFKLQSAVPADVNGDGVDEIVIAGYMNEGYTNGSSRGSISDKLVFNILLWNGSSYYLAWNDDEVLEKAVIRNTNIHVDNSGSKESENDPVTLVAAKLHAGSNADVIFCEGAFYSFVAGTDSTDANRNISTGSFNFVKNLSLENTDEAFVGVGVAGTFASDSPDTEQMYIVTGHNALGDDTCDLYVTAVWGESGSIKENRVDDYFNNVNEDDCGTTIALCPVNVDDDSSHYRYVGKTTGWSKPEIMCVLMSPPYWKELDYDGDYGTTSLEVTSSAETSLTSDWAAGVHIDTQYLFGAGVSAAGSAKFGFDISVAAEYVGSKTQAYTEGSSYTFKASNGENIVGLMAAPQISYNYEIYVPSHTATKEDVDAGTATSVDEKVEARVEDMSVVVTLDPVYSQMEIAKYNAVAKEYNASVDDTNKQLTIIDTDKLYAAGYDPGDPTTYAISAEGIQSLSDTSDEDAIPDSHTSTATTVGITSQPIELSLSESDSDAWNHGFSIDGSVSFVGTGTVKFLWLFQAETTWQLGVQGGGGCSWGFVDTNGLVYSADIAGLPSSAQTGTSASGNASSDYDFTTSMVRWYPSVLDRKTETSTDMKALEEWIPAVGYIVPALLGNVPAKLPDDLYVSATTTDAALITWSNPTSSTTRQAAKAYRLYVSTQMDEGYTEVALVTPSSSATTNYLVENLKAATTYYFKLEAYSDTAGTENRSVKSAAVKAVTKSSSSGPEITKAPENCYINLNDNNTDNDTPVFTIAAKPSSKNGTLSYQWQKLVVGTYGAEWVDLISSNTSDVTSASFNPAFYTNDKKVTADNKEALNQTIYRCIVTETLAGYETVKTYSRAVALHIDETKLDFSIKTDSDGIVSDADGKMEILAGSNVTTTITVKEGDTAISDHEVYLFVRKYGDSTADDTKNGIKLTTDKDGKATYTFKNLKAGTYQVMVGSKSQDEMNVNNNGNADDESMDSGTTMKTYQGYHSEILEVTVKEGCRITYDLDGGINSNNNPTFVTTATGTVSLEAPTKTDYTFLGWYLTADDGTQTAVTEINPSVHKGTISLTAKWKADVNEITYQLYGGVNNIDNLNVYTVEDYATLKKPTKAGYEFLGWYLDEDLKTKITYLQQAKGNVTFYAKWSDPIEYRIYYMLVDGVNHKNNPYTYTVEDDTIYLQDPVRDGYKFEGWYTDSSYTIPITTIEQASTGDVYLYAKWSQDMTSPKTGDTAVNNSFVIVLLAGSITACCWLILRKRAITK